MTRVRRWSRVGIVVALAALVAAPVLGVASAGSGSIFVITSCTGTTSQWQVNASVLWNGQNVCSARTTGSPISTTFGHAANVTFSWQTHGTASLNLTDARLAMYFLGFPIVTRDVAPVTATPAFGGTFDMNWAPGELTYAFEGLFRLTATIFAANGSTAFSENFYVKVTAPESVLAILPIALVALGIYEVYNLAISGRQALLSGRVGPAPAKTEGPKSPPGSTEPPDPAVTSSSATEPPSPGAGAP
jgi:hypothetical protein